MRASELRPVVQDLADLVGTTLADVRQPARDRVALRLGGVWLLVVPRGPLARLHRSNERAAGRQRPFSFQGACRAHLAGRLEAIDGGVDDRVVDLRFTSGRLHLRLTGRGGGLWLLDADDRVVAAYDGPAAGLPDLPPPGPQDAPPRFKPDPGERWSDAAGRWFGAEEARRFDVERRAELTRRVERELARGERLREALERDLDRSLEAPRLRRAADALAATLYTIPDSARSYEARDLEDPDVVHTFRFRAGERPGRALGDLYQRAKRLEDAGMRTMERLDDLARRRGALEAALSTLPTADDASLDAIDRLSPRGAPPSDVERTPYVVWRGPAGREVWVGRDASSNRQLVARFARGADLWLHLRDRPAAHVIVPLRGVASPPLDWLLAAAQIALVHGRVAEGDAVDVQYTRVRDIRLIPGDAHGRVTVHDEKVLHVRRDPTALDGWRRDP